MIASWLASKVWGLVIFCIACLSVVLIPAVVVQSVRLNGFSVLGWEVSEGYRPMALRLRQENTKLVANNLSLSSGLDKCNIGVTNLETARQAFQTAAQDLANERLRELDDYNKRATRASSVKPTDSVCTSVDALIKAGFGK